MKTNSSIRGGLLLTSACVALAACGGSEPQNAGTVGAVTVVEGGSGGTGGSGGAGDGAVSFVGTSGGAGGGASSCPAGTTEGTRTAAGVDLSACVISGTILSDTTLTADNAYILDGPVFVGTQLFTGGVIVPENQVTLTIEPGTVVAGLNGPDALIVSAGSQIVADGQSPNTPIIFTSAADLADADQDGSDLSAFNAASDGLVNGDEFEVGQWGGLVINGLAPINDCDNGDDNPTASATAQAECVKDGEGGSGLFGGNNPNDNSGTLRYVRVQYAGFGITADDELNGIAFQGVGDATTVEFIQVHNNDDDGVEFFGGTVNANYVVITGAGDDSIDWTDGWTGNMQYAVVVQTDTADTNRGIEGDNRNGDNDVLPQSNPTIANFTFVTNFAGDAPGDADDGIKLRRGTIGTFANGIVVGFNGQGIDYDNPSAGQDNGLRPSFLSTFVSGNAAPTDSDGSAIFMDGVDGNVASDVNSLNGIFSGGVEQDVASADLSGFTGFDNVDFIGAFDDDEDAIENSWLNGWVLANGLPNEVGGSCPSGTTESSRVVATDFPGRSEARVCVLPRNIVTDTRLVPGNLYEMNQTTFVGTDAGPDAAAPNSSSVQATLTIDPGVTVFGVDGPDALVVTRGSQIFSNGTANNPVVFTSDEDLAGSVTEFEVGQWGGIVINGRAPINDCENGDDTPQDNQVECEKDGEGGSGLFGGDSPTDNSGRLRYTRVQYAGFGITADDELNGIAFQGVGNGTEVDFIQVHNNDDDGVEFFGGTVNAKHVVITGAGDDSIDWTDGWVGNLQFAIVVQTQTNDANRGIEGDNRNGDNDVLPQSNPWISNFTFTTTYDPANPPGDADDGIKLRRGTRALLANGVVVNFAGQGCDYDSPSAGQDNGERPVLQSLYAANNDAASDGECTPLFTAAGNNNVSGTDGTLVSDTDGTSAALLPNTEITTSVTAFDMDGFGATVGGDRDGFFEDADYPGAIEDDSDNWYVGWTFGL